MSDMGDGIGKELLHSFFKIVAIALITVGVIIFLSRC
jgi:hypothetical protein